MAKSDNNSLKSITYRSFTMLTSLYCKVHFVMAHCVVNFNLQWPTNFIMKSVKSTKHLPRQGPIKVPGGPNFT